MRRHGSGIGCGACGRGSVTPPPGSPGTRSGGTRTPPQGACWTGTGANASSQETRTRGQNSPRWSAGRRGSVGTEATRLARRVGRLRQPPGGLAPNPRVSRNSAPSLGSRKRTTAYPGPQRIWAAERWLHPLVPAKAETEYWIPAYAGMSGDKVTHPGFRELFRVALPLSFWLYPRAFPVGVKRPSSGHPRRSWRRRERSFRMRHFNRG